MWGRAHWLHASGGDQLKSARGRRIEHLDLIFRAGIGQVDACRPPLVLKRAGAAGELNRVYALLLGRGPKRRERVPLRVRSDGQVLRIGISDPHARREIPNVDAAVTGAAELVGEPRLRPDP